MVLTPVGYLLHQADDLRRAAGHMLDALGLGPQRTPSRVIFSEPGLCVRSYDQATASGRYSPQTSGTTSVAVLLVPAPIKRAYIWDLAPAISVVRACLNRGFKTYVLEWRMPPAQNLSWGLAEFTDSSLSHVISAVREDSGHQRIALVAHSLGGTLAAIHAALRPEHARALVLIESPLCFGHRKDALTALIDFVPGAEIAGSLGREIPGAALDLLSTLVAPDVFHWNRWRDWLVSLTDPASVRIHLLVQRWTLDEMPMPRPLFEQVIERLYRRDEFMAGYLMINGERCDPAHVDAPVLTVFNPESRLVPPEMVLPFHQRSVHPQSQVLHSGYEVGTNLEHVASLVGRRAHRELWPRILDWMAAQ